ncbi:DUF4760 domain-containing protein [Luteibacter anthropi]|uniref:DUF4760 domain-containing protein n=1 Tax=Luteibacter anthropi TaxID=564369 RepID=A0A7X5UB11_9GAMM|nr:hypothetical protein [Luteibacter anthropi]NII07226.1 hypothetical protein [Luteibacter anthropi]
MLAKRKATLTYLFEKYDGGSAATLFLSVASMLIIGTSFFNGVLTASAAGYFLGFFSITLVSSFFRPIVAMAADGYESMVQVVLATWMLLVFAIASWCSCYFLVTGVVSSGTSGLKLLDIPTLLVAIGVASTGWYVSSQLTRRSQRTSHAVSLVLGSRTNGEFQKHNDRVRRYLPDKNFLDAVDEKFFGPLALRKAYETYLATKSAEALFDLKQAKAIESIKYMLNYYEFMAVGVRLGDIEDRILYDTIGGSVCALHDRTEKIRKWMVAPDGGKQILAFEYLDELVHRWKNMTADDEVERRKATDGTWRR